MAVPCRSNPGGGCCPSYVHWQRMSSLLGQGTPLTLEHDTRADQGKCAAGASHALILACQEIVLSCCGARVLPIDHHQSGPLAIHIAVTR